MAGYALGIYVLSPLLGALTDHISDDTITTLVTILLGVHLIFQDYGYLNGQSTSVEYNAPTSLNAAIFASLMLASRLPTSNHAFAIIISAITLFALFPMLAYQFKNRSNLISSALAVFMVVVAFFLLYTLSTTFCVVYILTVIFITFIAPFCLQWVQKYKKYVISDSFKFIY